MARLDIEKRIMRRVMWRLLPILTLAYVCAFLDRANLSFAAATMNVDLGFSATVYGLGGGLFFLGYALFEVPSNLACARFGPRRWLARIMITWGVLSAAMMFVTTPLQFYALRFLLGTAEAGFFPGVLYYLSIWIPSRFRGRAVSRFYVAVPFASVVMGGLSGQLLGLEGLAGLHGWQWLFLVEGLPSVLVGGLLLFTLPDRPETAAWLAQADRDRLVEALAGERVEPAVSSHGSGLVRSLRNPLVLAMGLSAGLGIGANAAVTLSTPTLLRDLAGLDASAIARVVVAGGLVGMVTMLVGANWADRRDARLRDGAGYRLFSGVGLALVAWAPSQNAVLIGYLVYVSLVHVGAAVLAAAWIDVLDEAEMAAGTALMNSMGQIGAFFSPTAFGLLRDATGDNQAGLALLAAMSIAAGLVVYPVIRARRAPVAARVPG